MVGAPSLWHGAWRNLGLFTALASCSLAAPAHAFRCTQAIDASGQAAGPALAWPGRKLTFTLQVDGTSQLPPADTFDILRTAFTVWQNLTLSDDAKALCGTTEAATDLTFFEAPQTSARWVGYNFLDPLANDNLLVFRDSAWHPGPTDGDIIALTTITYSALTGAILDADIEFNSANFNFAIDNPNSNQMDLLGTALHEVGHFLGLAHCTADGSQTCGHAEVMEPVGNYGATNKRQLKCDDRAAVVFKYPAGLANAYCPMPAEADCTSGCVPPHPPVQVPAIAQKNNDMGRGCQSAPLGAVSFALLLGYYMVCRQRRGRRRHRSSTIFSGFVLAIIGLTIPACQQTDCGGHAVPFAANAPLILNMSLVEQVNSDPWRVVLACDFVDPDGDLGAGHGQYFVNHDASTRQSFALQDVFAAAGGLSPQATSGRLGLLVRFAADTKPGAVLHLNIELIDAAGHTSNCYAIDLTFDLQDWNGSTLLPNP